MHILDLDNDGVVGGRCAVACHATTALHAPLHMFMSGASFPTDFVTPSLQPHSSLPWLMSENTPSLLILSTHG